MITQENGRCVFSATVYYVHNKIIFNIGLYLHHRVISTSCLLLELISELLIGFNSAGFNHLY